MWYLYTNCFVNSFRVFGLCFGGCGDAWLIKNWGNWIDCDTIGFSMIIIDIISTRNSDKIKKMQKNQGWPINRYSLSWKIIEHFTDLELYHLTVYAAKWITMSNVYYVTSSWCYTKLDVWHSVPLTKSSWISDENDKYLVSCLTRLWWIYPILSCYPLWAPVKVDQVILDKDTSNLIMLRDNDGYLLIHLACHFKDTA